MQTSPLSFHELHTNYTQNSSKTKSFFQNQNFNSYNLGIHLITLYKKMKVFLKVTNTSLYTNQKETTQETS
jgi:hypothetical protein